MMKERVMRKMYDSEFKARAVRMVGDHRADYPSVTAGCFAVAASWGCRGRRCAAG